MVNIVFCGNSVIIDPVSITAGEKTMKHLHLLFHLSLLNGLKPAEFAVLCFIFYHCMDSETESCTFNINDMHKSMPINLTAKQVDRAIARLVRVGDVECDNPFSVTQTFTMKRIFDRFFEPRKDDKSC